jgi:hypothetical protein
MCAIYTFVFTIAEWDARLRLVLHTLHSKKMHGVGQNRIHCYTIVV